MAEALKKKASFNDVLPTAAAIADLKRCPECPHVFRGKGWDGIDAHWKARHLVPYEEAWPLIVAACLTATSEQRFSCVAKSSRGNALIAGRSIPCHSRRRDSHETITAFPWRTRRTRRTARSLPSERPMGTHVIDTSAWTKRGAPWPSSKIG